MGEHGLAHGARPHSEAVGDLAGLRVECEVLSKRALVDVRLAAHRAWMVGDASLLLVELIVW